VSLESVVQAVQERGRSEADSIRADAEKEARSIVQAARDESAKIVTQAEARGREIAARRRVQELARAELEARRLVLSTQKEQLDDLYGRVQGRLASLPENDQILRDLLRTNEGTWKNGGKVYSAPKDEAVVRGVAAKAYAGTIDAIGGVVLENAEGSVRIDLRFESLLRQVWENSMKEVAGILWPSRALKA
jgi:V/A-type H+/Na+-transporting ATPase subunit E